METAGGRRAAAALRLLPQPPPSDLIVSPRLLLVFFSQRWTSQYSHPRSELTPSFGSASAADERLLKDLLTPSKDWWQGHRAGTAANTPDPLQRLDFGEAPTVEEEVNQAENEQQHDSSNTESGRKTRRGRVASAAKATRSSRASRRLDRSTLIEEETETEVTVTTTQKRRQRAAAAAAAVEEQQEETVAAAAAPYADDDVDASGGGGRFGDDADESESHNGNGVAAAASDSESENEAAPAYNGYDRSESPQRSESRLLSPASPASPGSLDEMRDELASPNASRVSRGGRRSSGTPSRHRRQWTHTVLPGIQEPRIHRIAPLQ